MKKFNLLAILLIILLAFCTEKKPEPVDTGISIVEGDTITDTLNYDAVLLLPSQFRTDTIIVKENDRLRFFNDTGDNATYVIPRSNILFSDNKEYPTFTDPVSNVQYIFISISKNGKSKQFIIHPNANPSPTERAIYPFSIFCMNGTQIAEGNSSPIIIVDP